MLVVVVVVVVVVCVSLPLESEASSETDDAQGDTVRWLRAPVGCAPVRTFARVLLRVRPRRGGEAGLVAVLEGVSLSMVIAQGT